jgi:hypothetical protein
MHLFPTHRQVRRARTRTVLFFFTCMAILTLAFAATVAIHRLLGWW